MKRRRLAAFLLLVLALAGVVAGYQYVNASFGSFTQPVMVEIRYGASSPEIALRLAGNGIVRHPAAFLLVRLVRPRITLQAGEYQFDKPASAWEIFDRIVRGDVHFYRVQVPEGSNIFETARLVGNLDFVGEQDFLKAAQDPSLILDLAPEATSLEGYLFPSTYFVTRAATAASIAGMMVNQFRSVWASLDATEDPHRTVTFASLVEKETGIASERPVVASVYANRLRRGMRLECDPTVIYAALLENRYRGAIYRSDLDRQHPYNTYRTSGLPPGPIASPGAEALRAALRPARTDYLFLVAKPDGSGEHVFSATNAAHNRAVREYRRGRAQAARQTGSR